MIKHSNDQVLAAWKQHHSIKGVAAALGVDFQIARRLLLTAGIKLDSPKTRRICELHASGMPIGQISQLLNMTRQAVATHLPYERGQTPRWTDEERAAALAGKPVDGRSVAAERVLRSRIRAPQRAHHDTPLRWARLRAGLTQAELANMSGVSLSYIQKLERGVTAMKDVSLDILRALTRALGCKIEDLVNHIFD